MKWFKSFLTCFCVVELGLGAGATENARAVVVDFEDLTPATESAAPGDTSETPFVSQGVSFNRTWNQTFDCCPGAWAYSNQTDLVTAGFTNPYSAYHLPSGGGVEGSSNFTVAFNSAPGDAVVTLPTATTVEGGYFTNNSFAYLSMLNGDGFAKKFGGAGGTDPDWFLLTVVGKDMSGADTGSVDFYLADYRNLDAAPDYIVDTWTWVDLTGLGSDVKTIESALSSSDAGEFGMNTPAYFALDDLKIVPLPGDMNDDGDVNAADVLLFVQAMVDRPAFEAVYPLVDADLVGDINENGQFDLGDLGPFGDLFNAASSAAVPEPPLSILLGGTLVWGVLRLRPRHPEIGSALQSARESVKIGGYRQLSVLLALPEFAAWSVEVCRKSAAVWASRSLGTRRSTSWKSASPRRGSIGGISRSKWRPMRSQAPLPGCTQWVFAAAMLPPPTSRRWSRCWTN